MFGRGYNGFTNGCGFGAGGFHGMHGGIFMMLALLALAVLITVLVMRKRQNKMETGGNEVMESLDMRYIKGEIEEEEYLRRKKIIRQK